jgi:hypothetical protein
MLDRPRWPWAALTAALSVLSAHASAEISDQQLQAARALANAGLELFQAGEYERAIERFRSAEEITHAPPHLLYMARAHRRLGRLVQARDLLRRVASETLPASAPPAFGRAQTEARKELEALEAELPSVRIVLRGALAGRDATVRVDGAILEREALASPVTLDPGEHAVTALVPGRPRVSKKVTLRAGEAPVEVVLELAPRPAAVVPKAPTAPAPASDPDDGPTSGSSDDPPIGPIVLVAVGGAGVVLGAVMGGLALGRASDLRDACPTNPCAPENESLRDEGRTFATVSTIGLVAGGLSLAGGVTWWVAGAAASADATRTGPRVALAASASGALVQGWFP